MPVLVELYTSQACSSCPPAEALLALWDRTQPVPGKRIVPLVFHVDYWDPLGWKDPHAQAAFSQRQQAYADRRGDGKVYTPQAIINGQRACVGQAQPCVLAAVQAARTQSLDLTLKGGLLGIQGLDPGLPLFVAVTQDGQVDQISGGENQGRRARGHATVTRFFAVPCAGPAARAALGRLPGRGTVVAFQCEAPQGRVLRAGWLPY
jgi:hypothetical protein